MTTERKDQGSKDKIKQGMSETGKQAGSDPSGKQGRTGGGSGGSDEITEGMAKSGSGTPSTDGGHDGRSSKGS